MFIQGRLLAAAALCSLVVSWGLPGATQAADKRKTIEFEGRQWVTSLAETVAVEEYRGTTALWVCGRNDTFVYLPEVEFQDGIIEVDIAVGVRSVSGIGFRGRDGGNWVDRILIDRLPGVPGTTNEVVEQAVVTRRNGTFVFLRIGVPKQDGFPEKPDLSGWCHVKLVIRGNAAEVYLNGSEEPVFEVGAMFDGIGKGTLGVCGGNFYFANFRYTTTEQIAACHDRTAGEDDLRPE